MDHNTLFKKENGWIYVWVISFLMKNFIKEKKRMEIDIYSIVILDTKIFFFLLYLIYVSYLFWFCFYIGSYFC